MQQVDPARRRLLQAPPEETYRLFPWKPHEAGAPSHLDASVRRHLHLAVLRQAVDPTDPSGRRQGALGVCCTQGTRAWQNLGRHHFGSNCRLLQFTNEELKLQYLTLSRCVFGFVLVLLEVLCLGPR